jgi:hypothetical protein
MVDTLMLHFVQYLNINKAPFLSNNTIILNNEFSIKTVTVILFFPKSKYLTCEKQSYWNQTSSFWGKFSFLF